jgi:hypothetical protein
MKIIKKTLVYLFALVLLVAGVLYGWQLFTEYQLNKPTKDNVERVARMLWENTNRISVANDFGDPGNMNCLSLPITPQPDVKFGRDYQPMAMTLYFFTDAEHSAERQKQLEQLDALTKVGLLEKSNVEVRVDDKLKQALSYRHTETGWLASSPGNGIPCFPYGISQFLGVVEYSSQALNTSPKREYYKVNIQVGYRPGDKIAAWAKDPAIQAAFPEVETFVHGKIIPVSLLRLDGKWGVGKSTPQRKFPYYGFYDSDLPAPAQKLKELNKLLPKPSIEEVKSQLEEYFAKWKNHPPTSGCLNLPHGSLPHGSERPVDEDFSRKPPFIYSVGISPNKYRKSYDRTPQSMHYLDELAEIGILNKTTLVDDGGDELNHYQMTPEYELYNHDDHAFCFPMGEASINVLDVELSDLKPAARFKLKVMYKNTPSWMKNPALLDQWAELRNMINEGIACEGMYDIDVRKQKISSGSASCWPAFDSVMK